MDAVNRRADERGNECASRHVAGRRRVVPWTGWARAGTDGSAW